MKKRKTIYHLIVDKSGSMNDCLEQTINGFNEQVSRIKQLEVEFQDEEMTIGLTTFNSNVKQNFFAVKPSETVPLTIEDYRPNGSTALLDAIGLTIQQIESAIQLIPKEVSTSVVVVILTDGYENASRIFDLNAIKQKISKLQEEGNWTFSFIGATLDAVDIAFKMSINKNNSYVFEKQKMNSEVWDKLSDSMSGYFNKKKAGKNFNNLFED
jgi:uncharacterized protein YegL